MAKKEDKTALSPKEVTRIMAATFAARVPVHEVVPGTYTFEDKRIFKNDKKEVEYISTTWMSEKGEIVSWGDYVITNSVTATKVAGTVQELIKEGGKRLQGLIAKNASFPQKIEILGYAIETQNGEKLINNSARYPKFREWAAEQRAKGKTASFQTWQEKVAAEGVSLKSLEDKDFSAEDPKFLRTSLIIKAPEFSATATSTEN